MMPLWLRSFWRVPSGGTAPRTSSQPRIEPLEERTVLSGKNTLPELARSGSADLLNETRHAELTSLASGEVETSRHGATTLTPEGTTSNSGGGSGSGGGQSFSSGPGYPILPAAFLPLFSGGDQTTSPATLAAVSSPLSLVPILPTLPGTAAALSGATSSPTDAGTSAPTLFAFASNPKPLATTANPVVTDVPSIPGVPLPSTAPLAVAPPNSPAADSASNATAPSTSPASVVSAVEKTPVTASVFEASLFRNVSPSTTVTPSTTPVPVNLLGTSQTAAVPERMGQETTSRAVVDTPTLSKVPEESQRANTPVGTTRSTFKQGDLVERVVPSDVLSKVNPQGATKGEGRAEDQLPHRLAVPEGTTVSAPENTVAAENVAKEDSETSASPLPVWVWVGAALASPLVFTLAPRRSSRSRPDAERERKTPTLLPR